MLRRDLSSIYGCFSSFSSNWQQLLLPSRTFDNFLTVEEQSPAKNITMQACSTTFRDWMMALDWEAHRPKHLVLCNLCWTHWDFAYKLELGAGFYAKLSARVDASWLLRVYSSCVQRARFSRVAFTVFFSAACLSCLFRTQAVLFWHPAIWMRNLHETPDVTPCRTSPPMPVFRSRLARNAWCNTISQLTAAGCIWHPAIWRRRLRRSPLPPTGSPVLPQPFGQSSAQAKRVLSPTGA